MYCLCLQAFSVTRQCKLSIISVEQDGSLFFIIVSFLDSQSSCSPPSQHLSTGLFSLFFSKSGNCVNKQSVHLLKFTINLKTCGNENSG